MIELSHLIKDYGEKRAVDDLNFTVRGGEILGFLGRNGAGKSTTMNMITGYLSPTSGTVRVDGFDILKHPREAKRHIGYLPEQPPLYMDMTVGEYLRFVCRLKEVARTKARSHIDDICELVHIADMRKRLIRNLSKGYRQRVGIAQALVGNPPALILDEPTVGLDPGQIIEIRRLIKDLGRDHTVILSSHLLAEVSDVCERLVILHNGRTVAEDSFANILRGLGESGSLMLRLDAPPEPAKDLLRALEGVRRVDDLGEKEPGSRDYRLEIERDADVRRDLFEALTRKGWPIWMLRPMDITLEDIFLRLTGGEEDAR